MAMDYVLNVATNCLIGKMNFPLCFLLCFNDTRLQLNAFNGAFICLPSENAASWILIKFATHSLAPAHGFQFPMRYATIILWFSPAALASLQASYMSCLISGLSSAIVSPTVTNLSTAKLTACPTRPIARSVRSEVMCGRSERC